MNSYSSGTKLTFRFRSESWRRVMTSSVRSILAGGLFGVFLVGTSTYADALTPVESSISLIGGAGWTTAPVAISNGDGTFEVTNDQVLSGSGSNFDSYASQTTVFRLTGDFDGNGTTDWVVLNAYNPDNN